MRNINKYLDLLKELNTKNEILVPKNFIDRILQKELGLELDSFNHSLGYSIDKKKRTHYKVFLKTDFAFFLEKFIERHYTDTNTDKSRLAVSGNTHNTRQDNSIVKVFQNKDYTEPKTLILRKGQTKIEGFTPGRECIIVENQHVFANYSDYHLNIPTLQKTVETDIIFGDGNRNNNSINDLLFNQYDKVHTFFDIDLAGFLMYLSLKRRLNTEVSNLFVHNIEEYFPFSKHDIDYDGVLNFRQKHEEYLTEEDLKIVNLMAKYKHGIEQEMFKIPIKQGRLGWV